MRSDETNRVFRVGELEGARQGQCPDHAGGSGIGILAIDHKYNKTRIRIPDSCNRILERKPLRITVEYRRTEPFDAAGFSQQQRPCWRFYRGVNFG